MADTYMGYTLVDDEPAIEVVVSRATLEALNSLAASGLFGQHIEACARAMIEGAVRQACLDGWLPMPFTEEADDGE